MECTVISNTAVYTIWRTIFSMVLVSRRGGRGGNYCVNVKEYLQFCIPVIIINLIIYQDTRDLAILINFDELVKSISVQIAI